MITYSRRLLLITSLLASAAALSDPAPLLQDASVNAAKPTTKMGSWAIMPVMQTPKKGLLQFDVNGFFGPSYSAVLTLNVTKVFRAGKFRLIPVLSPWDEKTVSYSTVPAFVEEGGLTFTVNAVGTVELEIADFVQRWISNAQVNYGLAVVSNAEGEYGSVAGSARFGTKEGGMGAMLTIESGSPPTTPSWPLVSCPCDAFYNHAVDFYLSLGGSLLDTSPPNPPGLSRCNQRFTELGDGYTNLDRVMEDGLTSLGLQARNDSDLGDIPNYRCAAYVSWPGDTIRQTKHWHSPRSLSQEEHDACRASVHDVCRDWVEDGEL